MNIALILVILTTIGGLVILYEKITNVIRKSQKKPLIKSEGTVSEYSHAFFPVLLVVLIIRCKKWHYYKTCKFQIKKLL